MASLWKLALGERETVVIAVFFDIIIVIIYTVMNKNKITII